ncbi:MAG: 1-phosphofructokinase [bacterium]|nr:1-phosphofructokinase [bacterium]
MIYTVTFNPALDYVVGVEDLTLGMVNRTTKENVFYGGKGINVSILLKELGYESIALGFVAGFTGNEIESGVKKAGVTTEFIHLQEGMSRINVKIKSKEESEINGQGPMITKEALKALFDRISRLEEGDLLVLAGSIPNTLPDDSYEKIMELVKAKKVDVVVDATKDLLHNVLKYHPFLIKPNNYELGELFGVTVKTDEEIIHYAKELQKLGARNVLVSMAGEGAILVDETGKDYKIGVPNGVVRNSVGAGDSMVAGFLAGYLETGEYEYALRLGAATGSATAFSDGLAEKALINELLEQI